MADAISENTPQAPLPQASVPQAVLPQVAQPLDPDAWTAAIATIATVAPLLGIAVTGPLSSFALSLIGVALGLDANATEAQMIDQLRHLSVDHLHALKVANQDFRTHMKKLDIPDQRLSGYAADDVATFTHRAHFPAVFATFISVMFFILLAVVAWHAIPDGANATVLNVMLGAVAASFNTVVSYFFGSSNSAGRKDLMLYNSVPAIRPT